MQLSLGRAPPPKHLFSEGVTGISGGGIFGSVAFTSLSRALPGKHRAMTRCRYLKHQGSCIYGCERHNYFVCHNYARSGHCSRGGDNCPYVHLQPRRAAAERPRNASSADSSVPSWASAAGESSTTQAEPEAEPRAGRATSDAGGASSSAAAAAVPSDAPDRNAEN